ncbi:putative Xaa-Pro aminopeptidase 3 [Araneus ventricosus]|uniref:Putative Xaa-Pro aminopeptidase 3 n=1 Tax=Araneus ventricosus TaxID=182803 RepID=A0A4Y2RZR2_ARAVE|nr:putative Xaa-Pro aminopeptidase 3 [Araneus ventricosus]
MNSLCYSLTGSILRSWNFKKILNKFSQRQWNFRNISASSKHILYSQPTASSHPHLLKNNEITHGITSDVYNRRRRRMVEIVHKKLSVTQDCFSHLIVIPSATIVNMTEKIPYFFRQNSDFFYVCGYKEPNSVLIIYTSPDPSNPIVKTVLFIPKQSPHSAKWEGQKMDLDTVVKFLGVDTALYTNDLEKFLSSFIKCNNRCAIWYDYLSTPFPLVHNTMRDFITANSMNIMLESPKSTLHQMRVIKSEDEADLMRKTCKIAALSMREVMKFSHPMICESHLEAKMDFECRLLGADHAAFPPVVGGADRASVIHYIDNNQIINDNELVLMDAGCEYNGYASDMARTWPVNGKFTPPQREVYEAVLSVQEELIEMLVTKLPLDDLMKIMCKKLGKEFQKLNIIPESVPEEKLAEAGFELCPHHVSHYLGMDVHDTSVISRGIHLQPGMVVTVEPGVYIPKNKEVPEKYKGICIRIEDDVLITSDGYEVLTSDCPKKVDEIENLFTTS